MPRIWRPTLFVLLSLIYLEVAQASHSNEPLTQLGGNIHSSSEQQITLAQDVSRWNELFDSAEPAQHSEDKEAVSSSTLKSRLRKTLSLALGEDVRIGFRRIKARGIKSAKRDIIDVNSHLASQSSSGIRKPKGYGIEVTFKFN